MSQLLIRGGSVVDPEALRLYPADLWIEDGRIRDILPPGGEASCGAPTIDASGCLICPGFIDPHTHMDGHVRTAQLSLLQGITTAVGGNCGFSPVDMEAFLSAQHGFPVHQAELVGMCALREAVGCIGEFEAASAKQAEQMKALALRALAQGAAGVSLGPAYVPGASIHEMEELCRAAKAYGRPASIDTRMNAMTDLHSLREAIELARETGCRMIVSHFVYQYGVGVEDEALEMVEQARKEGVDVLFDSGMYKDWCSAVGSALFEQDVMRDNGIELHHLRMITGAHLGEQPDQALLEHLRAEHGDDAIAVHTGSQRAVYAIARHPLCMISTDAGAYEPGEGHPQIAGSFPRFLREMVRERKEMSWEEAIRHITLLPAQAFGMRQKGRMRTGCDADIVIFDPNAIADTANFPGMGEPDGVNQGIRFVLVRGKIAVRDGKLTGVNAGEPICF